VDCQPQRFVLRVQSFRVSAVGRKQQVQRSFDVHFVVVDMSGLVRSLCEPVPFQEKPKRRAGVQYANEGMFTVVLNNTNKAILLARMSPLLWKY